MMDAFQDGISLLNDNQKRSDSAGYATLIRGLNNSEQNHPQSDRQISSNVTSNHKYFVRGDRCDSDEKI